MNVKPFDEIRIGDTRELRRVITRADVEKFVALSGDDNPLHTDTDFSSRTDLKEPVVHGMMIGNLISTLIGRSLPGPGALWISQELKFLAPVRVGDCIVILARVVAKHPRDQLIDLEMLARVEGRGDVLRGKGTVKKLEVSEVNGGQTKSLPVRRALVTGASGDIGKSISMALASVGFHVIAQYNLNEQSALRLQKDIQELGFQCDLVQCNLEDVINVELKVNDMLARFGRVDTFVAAAATSIYEADVLQATEHEIDRALSVQLHANLRILRLLAPIMVEQKWGRFIGISTDALNSLPPRGWLSYNLSKSALQVLVKQCAVELGSAGVTSNILAPGLTDTGYVNNLSARAKQVVAQSAPNRRLGRPADVASAVAFLCGLDAGHINGQTLRINGGLGFS